MARILGFQYGEMRGKLGGNVFSRNKAGAYVRSKVTPVNPQTVQQQTARYRFGNMSILYQSLSAGVKDCWQVFASTHFNPLKGNNTGIYTGGNAFVALRQSAGQGNQYRYTPSAVQVVTEVTCTASAYAETTEPPAAPISATIIDSGNIVREFQIEIGTIKTNGELNFQIIFPTGATDPTNTINSFTDATEQKFGIGFYISNNLKFEGSKPNRALKLNAWDTGVITDLEKGITGAGPTVAAPIIFTTTTLVDPANTRDFPCEDDWILVTPFVRSEKGAQKLLQPQYVKVTAP